MQKGKETVRSLPSDLFHSRKGMSYAETHS